MVNKSKMQEVYHEFKKMMSKSYVKGLATNPAQLPVVALLILAADLVLNILIVQRVPYTEIDWKAYMQECEGFLNGTFDYSLLRGDTGPLVYPAGFVYIYSALYFLTSHGENVRLAQYVFIVVYILQLCFVLRIYVKTKKVPPFVLVITILTSYRIHSIHVLRLFNDPIAVLLLFMSLNFFLDSKWYLGSVLYSLGVSVKMNILLYAPALFFFYLVNLGFNKTVIQLSICACVQLILGLPFLMKNPVAYLKGSFDVGRVFDHKWTVNYRFLSIEMFENKYFHLSLLALHVLLLILFLPLCIKYFKSYCRLRYVQRQVQPQIDAKNLEIKHKANVKSKQRLEKKSDEETLTKEQEDFLNSFESMLQKPTQKGKKPFKKPLEIDNNTHYSINFDILSQLFILPMFIINFIGIVCARSLHYQFYSWYFHSLPYLLWSTNYSIITRFLLLALIEMCWNTYPSTEFTSALLHVCHVSLLYGVYRKITAELNIASKAKSE